MFSSFPKYRLPDNLTSTNCMFLLTFLDFCPHLQQTAGLFSQFSRFLPSSPTDHRAFFSIFLIFTLIINRPQGFFSLFLFFALVSNRPQGFFLNFPDFYPRLQLTTGLFSQFSCFLPSSPTDIQPYSRYSPIPDHPDHITGNKKAKNKRSIILARLFSAYFSSFQNISHHSRISLITPEYLPSFQNISHHSRMSPIIPKCLSTFQLILAVKSSLLSWLSDPIYYPQYPQKYCKSV